VAENAATCQFLLFHTLLQLKIQPHKLCLFAKVAEDAATSNSSS